MTVKFAVCVTPPPVTEIGTTTCALTRLVSIRKLPLVEPAGITTVPGIVITEGFPFVSCNVSSDGGADATVTIPVEPLGSNAVEGLSVRDVGIACGKTVICVCALVPFHEAVTVAAVGVVTAAVWTAIAPAEAPAGTIAVAGGITADELLERFNTAPPAGASPVSATFSCALEDPVIVFELNEIDFIAGGRTVTCVDAVDELKVAVTVTGVDTVTCPTV